MRVSKLQESLLSPATLAQVLIDVTQKSNFKQTKVPEDLPSEVNWSFSCYSLQFKAVQSQEPKKKGKKKGKAGNRPCSTANFLLEPKRDYFKKTV